MKSPATKTIQKDIGRSDQNVTLTHVLIVGATRLRIEVESNAYKSQGHAHISRWNGEEWKQGCLA